MRDILKIVNSMHNLVHYIFAAFLFLNLTSYGQSYTFDKIVKAKFDTSHFPNQERTNLFNSKDTAYFMSAFSRNDSILARIFDKKHSTIHHFFIKDQITMDFQWLKTTKFSNQDKNYTFEFSDEKLKSDKGEIYMNIRDLKKRRSGKLKLTIAESDINLLHIFTTASLEPVFFKEIVPPFNFLVLNAKGTNTSGGEIEYQFISMNDISLTVKVLE